MTNSFSILSSSATPENLSTKKLISIEKAREIIRGNLPKPRISEVHTAHSLGYILAEDIHAVEDSPRYTNSKMDGLAICLYRENDQKNRGNIREYKIIGESSAGNPFKGKLNPGEAIRISTGAFVPESASLIVPIEHTIISGNTLYISTDAILKPATYIRFKGSEFKAGEKLIEKGTFISPDKIAILASQGINSVRVCSRPKVAIITTGEEIVTPTEKVGEYQLRNSNLIMLRNLVTLSGGEIVFTTHIGDKKEETKSKILEAESKSEIIVSSGGVSMGNHDLVKEAAMETGFDFLFWRVRQKPGKPLFFAAKEPKQPKASQTNRKLFFGLPGNPVSSFMTYLHYVHPTICHLRGMDFSLASPTFKGILVKDATNDIDRFHLARVFYQINTHKSKNVGDEREIEVEVLENQDSHKLTSITRAKGYTIIPPKTTLKKGETIEVYPFPWYVTTIQILRGKER